MGSGNGFGCRPACHLSPTIAESVGIPRRFAGEAVRTVTDDEKGRQLWRRLAVLTLTLAVYAWMLKARAVYSFMALFENEISASH